jgi:hypothetical protein
VLEAVVPLAVNAVGAVGGVVSVARVVILASLLASDKFPAASLAFTVKV